MSAFRVGSERDPVKTGNPGPFAVI
jgi:hypothetical protein